MLARVTSKMIIPGVDANDMDHNLRELRKGSTGCSAIWACAMTDS